jgi:RNA polymerase sigma factor (TIGR02999 family)
MGEVTCILKAIEQGRPLAAERLLPLVYDELRRLAAQKLAREKPGQTLTSTALVHEAYLRMVGQGDEARWKSRSHFYFAAAEAMRRILIENARRKGRHRRGGGLVRRELDTETLAAPVALEDLLAVNDALDRLAASQPQVVELVKLRYFAGLTIKQAADVLGVSSRTADSWWAYARAWLLAELQGDEV